MIRIKKMHQTHDNKWICFVIYKTTNNYYLRLYFDTKYI